MPDFMEAITNGLRIIGSQSVQQDFVPETKTATPPSTETKTETPPQGTETKTETKTETPPQGTETKTESTETKTEAPKFEAYELSPKEKGVLGKEELEPLQKLFTEKQIPKDAADFVHDYAEDLVQKTVEAVQGQLESRVKSWEDATKKDPEIMNEYGKNQELVRRYLTNQPHGFVDALKETGLLNHPDVIKYLIKQGKSNTDDSSTGTGTQTSHAPDISQTVKNVYKGLM
jgi:hypothetical protein